MSAFGQDYPDVAVPPPWDDRTQTPKTDQPLPDPRTWKPIDISPVLDGSWRPTEPTIGRRSDKVGLLYPGKVHTIASETEAGKTWLAVAVAADELGDGNHVAYLDFEDDEGGIVSRLVALQVNRDVIRDQFHYLRPTEPLGTAINRDDLRSLVVAYRPTLVVIDGITEAMTLHGLDPLNNRDVAAFGRILPRPLAAAGAAVACLDHVTKARETRGRYALGAVHKINGLDGAAYVLESRAAFGVGITGRSTIKLAKDRPGHLRRRALPSGEGMHWFGDLVVVSHDEDFVEVEISTPHERDDDFRPTDTMRRVSDALIEHGPLAARRIERVVRGKTETIRRALDFLILDGYVSDKTPHASQHPFPAPDEAAT